jgi:hypothetical protein
MVRRFGGEVKPSAQHVVHGPGKFPAGREHHFRRDGGVLGVQS